MSATTKLRQRLDPDTPRLFNEPEPVSPKLMGKPELRIGPHPGSRTLAPG